MPKRRRKAEVGVGVVPNEYVAAVRFDVKHAKCGKVTTLPGDVADTFARHPSSYTGLECKGCRKLVDLVNEEGERVFTWVADGRPVGVVGDADLEEAGREKPVEHKSNLSDGS
jgi:hypothetical protein